MQEDKPRVIWPSGLWTGYWTEPNRRSLPFKNHMDLELDFSNGIISGRGHDNVNRFLIAGSYDAAGIRCSFTKKYFMHKVHYEGVLDSNRIYGGWKMRELFGLFETASGGFCISRGAMSASAEAKAEEALSHPVHVRDLVLS